MSNKYGGQGQNQMWTQEFRKKGKSFGADLPHPGCYKVQKVPGYIGLRQIITQNILANIM